MCRMPAGGLPPACICTVWQPWHLLVPETCLLCFHADVCRSESKREATSYANKDSKAEDPVKPAGNPPAAAAV